MAEKTEKKRLTRAVKRAADVLVNSNYRVTLLQGEVFNLEALREREIRKIRVVLDAIKHDDEQKVRALRLPGICTKEIWCKRLNEPVFLIKEIRQ
jgi:hypothetical protein